MAFVVSSTIASAPRRCPSGCLLQAMSVDASLRSPPACNLRLYISLRSARSIPARRRLIRSVRRFLATSGATFRRCRASKAKLKTMKLHALLVLLSLASIASAQEAKRGQRPPAEVAAKAQPALNEGRRALEAQDAAAVRVAVAKAIAALGPWAGNPETATRYFPPVVTTPL